MGGGFFSTKMASLCVGCVWALSIAVNGPRFVWADVIASRRSQQDCTLPYVVQIYPQLKRIVMFFIPLVVTWVSYVGIIYKTHNIRKTVTIPT